MKTNEFEKCPLCGEIVERDQRQLMGTQLLCFCEKCKKFYIKDLPCPQRVEITIKISGARASGKTRLITYLSEIFEEQGAEIDLNGVPDIVGYAGYRRNLKQSLKDHSADPIQLDKMKIKFIEEAPLESQSTLSVARANLKLFGRR